MKASVSLAIVASLHYASAQVFTNSSTTASTTSNILSSVLSSALSTVSSAASSAVSSVSTSSVAPTVAPTTSTPAVEPTTSSTEASESVPVVTPTTTGEVPSVVPVSTSTNIPTLTTSGSPYGTSNPVIGIETIYIEDIVIIAGRRQKRQVSSETLTIAHRDIYPSPTASIPCYPCVLGYPPAGGELLVETVSS